MMTRPRVTTEMLLAYAGGNLHGLDVPAIEAFLAADRDAAEMVQRYRLVARLVRSDDAVAPPPASMHAAKAKFDAAALPKIQTWVDRLDQLVASLVFDSRVQPAALRYKDTGERFQLAYEADGAEIELQAQCLAPDSGASGIEATQWRIMGQVDVNDGAARCEVLLRVRSSGETAAATSTDNRGRFTVEAPSGDYELLIALPQHQVSIPDLRLE